MWKMTLASSIASAITLLGYWGIPAQLAGSTGINPETAQEQCRDNPDAFFAGVRQQAEADLRSMTETRNSLRTSSADVENLHAEVQEKLSYASSAAQDFRAAWQADSFPVMIRGRAYTKNDVEAQTSSLLAQIDGYNEAIAKYTRTIADIRQHVEDLTARIVTTETDLGLLDTRCQGHSQRIGRRCSDGCRGQPVCRKCLGHQCIAHPQCGRDDSGYGDSHPGQPQPGRQFPDWEMMAS